MADKEEILLEIIVSNDAATQAIFESQKAIDKLKQSQADLTTEFKKGSITQEEYSKKSTAVKAAIGQQNEAIRANEKEIKNNIKTQNSQNDSLVSLRAQLSNNTKAYDNLSKAERDSAKGQELQKSIVSITRELKEGEEATDRFQRTVGKYPETMGGAGKGVNQITGFLGKMGDQLGVTGGFAGGFTNTLSKASSVIGGFASKSDLAAESAVNLTNDLSGSAEAINAVEGFAGKASGTLSNLSGDAVAAGQATGGAFSAITKGAVTMGKAFLAPPIIIVTAIILAIIGAVKLLSEGFKKNDEASEKMSETFAVFTPILDAIGTLFTWVAGAVADLVLGFSKGLAAIVDFTAGLFGVETGLSAAAEEARNLVRAQDELEEAERNFTVNSAKRNLERAKLMAEVTDKNKNDAKTRIALLADALELDKQNLVDEKNIADERLRIIEQVAKNENDTSDDTAKKIADARAAAYNAQTKYFEGVKEINKKLNSAEDELANEQKARFEDWKKNKDDQIAKEKIYLRQLEDLVTAEIKNDLARQIQAEKLSTERANADLKDKLKTEKNLTKEARAAINEIILLNKQNLDEKIAELNKKASDDEIKKQIEQQQQIISAKIELATRGSDEELNLLYSKLELQKSVELSAVDLTNVERLAIINKYDDQEKVLRDKNLNEKTNAIKNALTSEFDLRVLQLENIHSSETEILNAKYDREVAENARLKSLDDEAKNAAYESQVAYEIAVAESNQRMLESQEAVFQSQLKGTEQFLDSIYSINESMVAISNNISDNSEESAKFAKSIALVQIGLSLAIGIAGAVKQAAAATTWYESIAALAVGIASVTSAIAGARGALDDTPNVPNSPKGKSVRRMATGGLVSGLGSGTSDSIPTMLSNGESVNNARSTSMFSPILSALNVAGGGVAFGTQDANNQLHGEEMLARAFARGASSLPPQQVSVKEIIEVQDRLTLLESLTT